MIGSINVDGFQIIQKIGMGGYGEIYIVQKDGDPELYALKTEDIETNQKGMLQEIEIMNSLPNCPFFSRIIVAGNTSAVNYFVMPLYGPSLNSLRNQLQTRYFSLSTATRIARKMLIILETLHEAGFVHCDVKPSNFLLQQHKVGGIVLVDFGLSSRFMDLKNGTHIENAPSDGFRGTLKYASINVHKFVEPTRRDDIISWFYSYIEMVRGQLPWGDVRDKNLSLSCKQAITTEKLCHGLPNEAKDIYNYIKNIRFEEKPDYGLIYTLLDQTITMNNWSESDLYDWETQPTIIHQLTPFPHLFDKNLSALKPSDEEKRCCCIIQ